MSFGPCWQVRNNRQSASERGSVPRGAANDGDLELFYPFYLDIDMTMAFAGALTGGVAGQCDGMGWYSRWRNDHPANGSSVRSTRVGAEYGSALRHRSDVPGHRGQVNLCTIGPRPRQGLLDGAGQALTSSQSTTEPLVLISWRREAEATMLAVAAHDVDENWLASWLSRESSRALRILSRRHDLGSSRVWRGKGCQDPFRNELIFLHSPRHTGGVDGQASGCGAAGTARIVVGDGHAQEELDAEEFESDWSEGRFSDDPCSTTVARDDANRHPRPRGARAPNR